MTALVSYTTAGFEFLFYLYVVFCLTLIVGYYRYPLYSVGCKRVAVIPTERSRVLDGQFHLIKVTMPTSMSAGEPYSAWRPIQGIHEITQGTSLA